MTVYHNRIPPDDRDAAQRPHQPHAAGPPGDGQSGDDRASEAVAGVQAAVQTISGLLTELKDYAGYYVSAKLDGIKLSATKLAIYAVLGLLGMLIGAAVLITASVLLIVGLANAIGAIFDIQWLGWLIVGLLVLGGTAAAVYFGISAMFKTTHKQMVDKYETKRERQRADYGTHVRDRAASAP